MRYASLISDSRLFHPMMSFCHISADHLDMWHQRFSKGRATHTKLISSVWALFSSTWCLAGTYLVVKTSKNC
jgi:hypothetical protein